MESSVYRRAFEKGRAEALTDILIRILSHWLDSVDTTLEDRLRAVSDPNLLDAWVKEGVLLTNAEQADRLADKIQKAVAP